MEERDYQKKVEAARRDKATHVEKIREIGTIPPALPHRHFINPSTPDDLFIHLDGEFDSDLPFQAERGANAATMLSCLICADVRNSDMMSCVGGFTDNIDRYERQGQKGMSKKFIYVYLRRYYNNPKQLPH